MRNLMTKATLGVALGAAVLTAAVPADAQRYRHHRHRDHTGTAVVAGLAGLAVGAALTSSSRYDRGYNYNRGYDRGYYNDGYYDRGYYDRRAYRGYDRGYVRCHTRRVYDPYIGRRVRVRYCN